MRTFILACLVLLASQPAKPARLFVTASSQGYRTSASPVSTYPVTISAWCKITAAQNQAVASICNTSSGNRVVLGCLAGGTTSFQSGPGGTVAPSGQSISTGVWHHYAGTVTISSTTITTTAWLDGTSTTTTGTDSGAQAWNAVGIAERHNGTSWGIFFGGDVDDVAIWKVALSSVEILQLNSGAAPIKVRPDSLVFWVRAGEIVVDRVGGLALTTDGSPALSTSGPRTWGAR